ncbi:PREDICTED: nuclear factor related to kappa-B-binding protein isoform X2 [Drosophila arizonae]|uniref:Nuclear factor related to kappa-B-binding protein isoform X2 n=1 Tax=Drosophila arizonae TaxID=7263 RepID=A0ABM1NM58_DROAR|nr:PREDICTED: nuclear factor related to kappa-B-binding protein isoform X2 [Drosophila arizonae]
MSNNNSNNISNSSMPYPESEEEEEELSGSYNINDNGGQLSDCSSSNSSAASSSGKTESSSNNNSSDEDDDDDDDDATDQDTHTDTDSDDATTTQSDELELAQFDDRHVFRLPRGLCENARIFHEFFSVETWQMLPNNMQARLQPLLPSYAGFLAPAQAAAEQQRTLLQLFNGGIQRFGQSPLLRLQRQLEEGNLRPDVLQLRQSIQRSQRRECRFQKAERLSRLAKELFLSREQLLQQVYTMAPPSTDGDTFKVQPRPRKRKTPTLNRENKFCVERARKRYCQELVQLARELNLQPGDISADEQDEEAAQLAIIAEERQLKVETSTRPSNAADKKCIYSTFFKRRPGLEDEQVLRSMQSDRIQPLNEKNFKKYLRDYKRRKLQHPQLPDFDTADIRLRDICTRAQFVGNFKPGRKPKALMARFNQQQVTEPPALVPIGGKVKQVEPVAELLTDEPQQLYGRAAFEPDEDELEQELQEQPEIRKPMSKAMAPAAVVALAQQLPKLEPIVARAVFSSNSPRALIKAGAHITGSPTRDHTTASVTQRSHGCYFSLLRDLFVSTPQHRLTYQELQSQLLKWRTDNSAGGLPDWVRLLPNEWTQLLQSAVSFLSGDFVGLPAEYVPYIEHKTQLNIYQWIGAGRDSDARLQTLCQYWLQQCKEDTATMDQLPLQQQQQQPHQQLSPVAALDVTPTPPPRCPTSWAVRVATQSEMLEFQRQERLRFDQPHRPFTYRMHGYESVVGPVKGIYTQSLALNKARGHAVMVDDRPPYVTILTLVRDATARLPNGEGTRSEISELLKCSQFINRQAAENVLQTIVSGALDRMHGGLDPCVRYDARRKIWIYLHRNRSEADFERMHRQNQTIVKQKQQQRKHNKPKKDEAVDQCPQELPALVAASTATTNATSTVATSTTSNPTAVMIKKHAQSSTLPLQVKFPPVPPLKYHVPPAGSVASGGNAVISSQQLATTQKSLLKPTQRSGVVTLLERSPGSGTVQLLKTSPKALQQQQQQVGQNSSPTRNTTPILVSTPSGLQTVHVAATPNKKVTIKKPIVINSPTQTQAPATATAASSTGSFILPLDQQQQQLSQPNKASPARQQMPKNIIRLLPASGVTSPAASKPSVVQLPGSPTVVRPTPPVQILGPRMLAQTTVRPLQQKIGGVSIVNSKPATSASGGTIPNAASGGSQTGTGTGTIVKMSPQAFATLQQQQLKQKQQQSQQPQQQQQQQQPQQRILVGNTAISSNKNIVFQALPKAAPKILSTVTGQAKPLATANLSPQQQRIVLQSFKQPISTAAAGGGGGAGAASGAAVAVATSQATTRIIRTSPVAATTSAGTSTATQSGHIVTLESLLQKQNAGKLIQLATTATGGNVITLTPNSQTQQQQQQLATTKQLPATARIVTGGHATMVPKIIGKTTVMSGKPLLLTAKTLKLGGAAVVSTQTSTATTLTTGGGVAGLKTAQNIVIGGQTVKLQGTTIPARNASGGPMQTVIMGNQLLRLATSSNTTSISNSSQPSTSTAIATAPKTLLIGAGATQTLRLGKNVLLATSSSGSNVSTTSTVATTTTTPANNLVFAVQNNGGQLFFTPGLQGVNLKPLSNMKVIPMSTASATVGAGSGVKLSNVTTATVDAVAGKALNTKLLPAAVLKTASGGHGN